MNDACDKCNLEGRVNKLEEDYHKLESNYHKMQLDNAVNNQRVADALEKLSTLPNTLNEMQKSNIELSHKVNDTNKEVAIVKEKMIALDEKSKFDIMSYIKSNLPALIVAASALAVFYAQGHFVF